MDKKWTECEIKYLTDNYSNSTTNELQTKIDRSKNSIIAMAFKLGLKKSPTFISGNKWTNEEVDWLVRNYSCLSTKNISEYLNRSVSSVVNKADEMNLKKSKSHRSKMIAKRNKMIGRDLTYENLKTIAAKYKTRGEFLLSDSSAYQSARRRGILDDICSHMIKQSYSIPQLILKFLLKKLLDSDILYNTRSIITPYELDIYIPEFRLAFEYNGKGWHINDKIDKHSLCENKKIKLFTLVEKNRKYESDIKLQLAGILSEINKITGKNIIDTDVFSINITSDAFEDIIDEKKIRTLCNKYTHYSDFRKENQNLCDKLRKLKKFNLFTSHMIRNSKKWDLELIVAEIEKYEYLGDLINNSRNCYQWVKRNKMEHLLSGLILKQNKRLKYGSSKIK